MKYMQVKCGACGRRIGEFHFNESIELGYIDDAWGFQYTVSGMCRDCFNRKIPIMTTLKNEIRKVRSTSGTTS